MQRDSIRSEQRTPLTFEKGLAVLEVVANLAGRRGVTASELCQHLSVNRSTLYRFLSTLKSRGYVEQDSGSDRYKLGFRTLELSAAYIDSLELRDVVSPFLEELNRTTGETVYMVALDRGEVVTIDRLEGVQPYSLRSNIGSRRPAHCTAAGKAMMAYLPEDALDALLDKELRACTRHTIISVDELREELRRVRSVGFATDDEEYLEGTRCAAAPIWDYTRRVVAGLSLAAHASYTSRERILELGSQIRDTARRVSQRLGYRSLADGTG